LLVHMLRMRKNGTGSIPSYFFHTFLLMVALAISISQFVSE
jgi:hypothetical protein